jgi:hypothetical protein
MDYEPIRAARLRRPFQPFYLRTHDGRVFFVREDLHIAVAPKVVAFYDADQGPEILKPSEIESLTYADQPLGTTVNGH